MKMFYRILQSKSTFLIHKSKLTWSQISKINLWSKLRNKKPFWNNSQINGQKLKLGLVGRVVEIGLILMNINNSNSHWSHNLAIIYKIKKKF